MKKIIIAVLVVTGSLSLAAQDAKQVLDRVDRNMSSENRVFESDMIIYGRRTSRTIASRTYSVGDKQSFTEYLSPAREQGTKMLKLEDKLWIYSPSTDRTIQISGHLLRQSVMGSDLSYEDMMDDRKLTETYDATIAGHEEIEGRNCFVLDLKAIVADVAYHSQKIWVDSERYVPLKQEMYARSGKLLKRITLSDVEKIQGRWFPTTMVYKDMLKDGEGTEFRVTSAKFDQDIPEHIFSKASLK